MAALAALTSDHGDIRRLARPSMIALSTEVGETVNLVVMEGTEAVYLESVVAKKTVTVIAPRAGSRLPAERTAAGRILLAHQRAGISGDDDHHWRLRHSGFASERGQVTPGVACVAVPLHLDSQVVAALSVSCPEQRFDLARLLTPFQDAGRRISAALCA